MPEAADDALIRAAIITIGGKYHFAKRRDAFDGALTRCGMKLSGRHGMGRSPVSFSDKPPVGIPTCGNCKRLGEVPYSTTV